MEEREEAGIGSKLLENGHGEHYQHLKAMVLERLDCSEEIEDAKVFEWIDAAIIQYGQEVYINYEEKLRLRQEIFNSLRKLDVLQELVDSSGITEIMINGAEDVFIEEKGRIRKWEKNFESSEKLEDVVQQIVGRTNRMVNESSPIVDTRLENGSRVNIVLPPVALNGPIVTIRKFPDKTIQMEDLISFGSIDEQTAQFLKGLVEAKYNIFISGGTGSGKTTFLNVLSNFIPQDERIITIEDSAELQIKNIPNLVRLETRNANSEGKNEITMRDLIKSALRMRPDRIVVGEVRGGEAVDMIQCLNTGHDGSLSTGHSNSSKDMLSRLEMMILMGIELPLEAVRRQIASGVDIIVHLGRLRDKSRKVLEIVEIAGYEHGEIQTNPLYIFEEEGEKDGKIKGRLCRCKTLIHKEKLIQQGVQVCE